MADDNYYVWSPLRVGNSSKVIGVGNRVTAESLKMTDEQFQELIDVGSIRKRQHPETQEGESPNDYYKRKLAEAAADVQFNADADIEASQEETLTEKELEAQRNT